MVEWTMQLNNILQANGRAGQVTYDSRHEGPDNKGLWHVKALSNGQETGSGSGKTRMEAKELASKNAMKVLYPDHHKALEGK
ncbi:hypothetical protein A7U60_g7210 [Sanghuangporus baumii]|uniref:DRBM domain-containing protein n=1 Tax=Sanghuangporus baumii TaxID=108892 RepID=A0A9Q5N654_SANBA|nr:hypothetical protein A7U60_g7210 [Sanghuangporus baumii]